LRGLQRRNKPLHCGWLKATTQFPAPRLAWETSKLLRTAFGRSATKSPALQLVQGANGMPFIAVGVRDTQKRLALLLH
jgi:hypothetical protein